MDGMINIYKPPGMTSFACVSKVRKMTGASKAGHAGTLDPEASGVLPVCIGKATKCADMFLEMDKTYKGEITFGKETDTCDIWGSTVSYTDKNDEKLESITKESIIKCAETFKGETEQVPPDYAAVKINGVPAYRLARQGKQFEIKSRRIHIYDISVESYDINADGYPKAVILVKCSRGTYIRSLFRDIGRKLGVPACMSALERTGYGFMDAAYSLTPDRLSEVLKNRDERRDMTGKAFFGIEYMLKDAPSFVPDDREERSFINGSPIKIPAYDERCGHFKDGGRARVYTKDGRLISFADTGFSDGEWKLVTYKFFDCKGDMSFE